MDLTEVDEDYVYRRHDFMEIIREKDRRLLFLKAQVGFLMELRIKREIQDAKRYETSYLDLCRFVESVSDIYNRELRMILCPILVHMYIELMSDDDPYKAIGLISIFRRRVERHYQKDLRKLLHVRKCEDMNGNALIDMFQKNKFSIRMSSDTLSLLKRHLNGMRSSVLRSIVQEHFYFDIYEGGPCNKKQIVATTGDATRQQNKDKQKRRKGKKDSLFSNKTNSDPNALPDSQNAPDKQNKRKDKKETMFWNMAKSDPNALPVKPKKRKDKKDAMFLNETKSDPNGPPDKKNAPDKEKKRKDKKDPLFSNNKKSDPNAPPDKENGSDKQNTSEKKRKDQKDPLSSNSTKSDPNAPPDKENASDKQKKIKDQKDPLSSNRTKSDLNASPDKQNAPDTQNASDKQKKRKDNKDPLFSNKTSSDTNAPPDIQNASDTENTSDKQKNRKEKKYPMFSNNMKSDPNAPPDKQNVPDKQKTRKDKKDPLFSNKVKSDQNAPPNKQNIPDTQKNRNDKDTLFSNKSKTDPNAALPDRIPLRELSDNEKVEKVEALFETTNRVELNAETPSSICCYTKRDANHSVTCAEITQESSMLAVGLSDYVGNVRSLVPINLRTMKSAPQLQDINTKADDVRGRMLDDHTLDHSTAELRCGGDKFGG